jgi:hypothetical protein
MPTEDGKLTVGILLFEDAEALDFCGPFEVFSVTGRLKVTGRIRGEPTRLSTSTSLPKASDR